MHFSLYKLLLGCLSVGIVQADNALPAQFRQRAIYYPITTQIDGFSCGYNALFNAANFEHLCGFSNPVQAYDIFKGRTMAFLKKNGRAPLDSSDNKLTELLGTSILQLQPLYHLTFSRDIQDTIVLSGSVTVTYQKGTPQSHIDRLFTQAHIQRTNDQFTACNSYLTARKGSTALIHFLCYVRSRIGKHIVMISLYQNSSGRALYVFDNVNEPLTMQHDTVRYLNFLSQKFEISNKKDFLAPIVPSKWPSLVSNY